MKAIDKVISPTTQGSQRGRLRNILIEDLLINSRPGELGGIFDSGGSTLNLGLVFLGNGLVQRYLYQIKVNRYDHSTENNFVPIWSDKLDLMQQIYNNCVQRWELEN